jgi:hypothetical protein
MVEENNREAIVKRIDERETNRLGPAFDYFDTERESKFVT